MRIKSNELIARLRAHQAEATSEKSSQLRKTTTYFDVESIIDTLVSDQCFGLLDIFDSVKLEIAERLERLCYKSKHKKPMKISIKEFIQKRRRHKYLHAKGAAYTRLWHKDMLEALPKKQLLEQWRECCIIAKAIKENIPHPLTARVKNYPLSHFYSYSAIVYNEMLRRRYMVWGIKFYKYIDHTDAILIPRQEIFKEWHNENYFDACVYTLYTLYNKGNMTKEEWLKIMELKRRRPLNRLAASIGRLGVQLNKVAIDIGQAFAEGFKHISERGF